MRVGGSEVESSSSVVSRRMETRYSVSEMSVVSWSQRVVWDMEE